MTRRRSLNRLWVAKPTSVRYLFGLAYYLSSASMLFYRSRAKRCCAGQKAYWPPKTASEAMRYVLSLRTFRTYRFNSGDALDGSAL